MKTIIIFTLIIIACSNSAFTQMQPMYGATQAQAAYGAPQQMYGIPQTQVTYGTQQPQLTYGSPQVQQYGTPRVQQYGAPQGQNPIYDNSYSGLFNMYGQPTFMGQGYQSRVPEQGQQQPGQDGLIFQGAAVVQSVGSYLWSYMPAPLRGADSGYFGPAGTGPTIINFTPGTQ